MLVVFFLEAHPSGRVAETREAQCPLFPLAPSGSSRVTQHFRKHNKVHILETLRCKRVKEKKLLSMQAEEVQLLSFMEEEDKKLLPIIIKDFVDNEEFFDIRARIDREVSGTHIFQ